VNDAFSSHIFEPLVRKTSEVGYAPALAESWRAVDATTWEFALRKGVKFHDGSDFDAADVLYSIERIPNVKGSPSPRTLNIAPIKETRVLDPHTIRLITDRPTPILPKMLAEVYITSDSVKSNDPQDFNKGRAAVGTGPYRFVEWVPGDRITLERYEGYWGAKPDHQKVTLRPIGAAAARVAALLSGGVDIIDNPPSNDIPRLKADPNLATNTVETCRVIYLAMDQAREPTPFVEGTDGKNPFKDRRVRRAISHAINRDAIVERVMGGRATPAGLMTSKTVFGHNPDLKPDAHDPELAKRLLAEAGYPNGFKLVLHGPNDRYINDERVIQAVAQQLARVGIQASVEAQPRAVYFPDMGKHSLSLWGQGCGGGEAHHGLTTLVYSQGKIKGFGGSNAGKYSNPELDALIDQIMTTGDDAERARLQRLAEAKAKEDVAIIPLYWEHTSWATRKTVRYEGGVEQWNVATSAFVAR
jgi:peptide/nickel transport system substrate-binding protein